MKRLAILLSALTALAAVAALAMAYVGIFTHSDEWGSASLITLVTAVIAGFGAARLWSGATP